MSAAGCWTQQAVRTGREPAHGAVRTTSRATAVRPLVLLSSLAAGGAERVVVSLVCRLAQRGLHPLLCTVAGRADAGLAEELHRAGVTRYNLGAWRLCDPRAWLRYVRLLARGDFDIVHAHGQDAWILASMARPLVTPPLVLTRHVLEEPAVTWRQALRRRLALVAARRADALVAPSSATVDRLARLTGVRASHVHVIPNGVDVKRFDRPLAGDTREALRRILGFCPNERVVLLPAVLRDGKGHDVLLDALPSIHRVLPDVTVAFAGGGERHAELRQRARPYGDRVRFLGHRNDVPELLAACDLVVLPSFAEVLPMALLEAAACARPVVATRVGGIDDIVEHGVTGLLVPPGDARALAEAVVAVLSDPATGRRFGQEGRRIARDRFSLDGHVDRTLDLWLQVASTAREARS